VTRLGHSELDVFPLCLGGNVFGWTADERTSFDILDAYLAAGGNFVDTADSYSAFAPGNEGGESETIIGRWLAAREVRDRVVIATKVGSWAVHPGLQPQNIRAAVEDSLRRLQTDHIDLYYAHRDFPDTPLEESLATFDELVTAGKVRAVGLSNYSAERLAEALAICDRDGLVRPVAIQPQYSLVVRDEYEGGLAELCERENIACLPYWALASGFLTGKYRPGVSVDSARAGQAATYLEDERSAGLLGALEAIAAAQSVPVGAVALAWVREQPGVVAPIASARTVEQLPGILPGATLELSTDELDGLTAAWS
jgi:aryl-alcohol dehydrogenase-like predicted oxidoreductase